MVRFTGTTGITSSSSRLLAVFVAACWLAAALYAAEGSVPHDSRPATPITAALRNEPTIHEATTATRTLQSARPKRHPDYKEHVDPLAEIREALRRTELHEPFREHACGQPPHFSFDPAGCILPWLDTAIPSSGVECHRHSRAPPPLA
jgi:hypothetical protein